MRTRLSDPFPVTLDVVPATLRDRTDEERRALVFAAGTDPLRDPDAKIAAFLAVTLLLCFVAVALLR